MFSVVIPTHDRLDLLRDATETVLKQEYRDWELVIFDNASSDDIAGYVAGIADPRVKYERSDEFLPVTESWNRAIGLARGRYVTFLGDDDGLTPGYFTGISRIIEEFGSPEILYSAIFQFLHPGVAPWERRGYVADVRNAFFFADRRTPFLLSREEGSKAVQGSLDLRRNFTFNIQAFVFSRTFLDKLGKDGPIFRSPFPDYYLANIALAKASSVVVIPSPMSIAGVSKASFGYTLFNGLEEKGTELLNAKLTLDPLYPEVEKFLLPGPLYHTNYVVTMEHVARYAGDFLVRGVDFQRYRRLQILTMISSHRGRLWKTSGAKLLWSRLRLWEKLWAAGISLLLRSSDIVRLYERLALPFLQRRVGLYGFQPAVRMCDRGSFSRLIQVFDAIGTGAIRAAPASSSATHSA